MSLDMEEIREYVRLNIVEFHQNRLKALKSLKLEKILKRKNPYLFKAKNILKAQTLVENLLDAYLSSQEETIFGEFLEGLAIYICGKVCNGRKSSSEGIDLEFELEGIKYIVSVKSGPNWGNSRQLSKMREDFKRATKILRTSNSKINVIAVNGCCYGQDNKNMGDYFKYCGQKFWEFISGNENLYIEIIEPLGCQAKERNDSFTKEYAKIINNFTHEFIEEFCKDGAVEWEKLVEFNSGKEKIKKESKRTKKDKNTG